MTTLSTRLRQAFTVIAVLVAIVATGGFLGWMTYDEPTVRNFAISTSSDSLKMPELATSGASQEMQRQLGAKNFELDTKEVSVREGKLATQEIWDDTLFGKIEIWDGSITASGRNGISCLMPTDVTAKDAIDLINTVLVELTLNGQFVPSGTGVTEKTTISTSYADGTIVLKCYRDIDSQN